MSDERLRSDLLKIASELPRGDETRRKLLAALKTARMEWVKGDSYRVIKPGGVLHVDGGTKYLGKEKLPVGATLKYISLTPSGNQRSPYFEWVEKGLYGYFYPESWGWPADGYLEHVGGSKTARGMDPVITEEDWEAIEDDRDLKRQWKGYKMSQTYEVWDEEALEIGETNDKGWEYEDVHFDYLDELLDDADTDWSWLEWSSSSPGPRDWIVGQDDEDYSSGDRTRRDLFIERADGVPLSRDEIKHITKRLRL